MLRNALFLAFVLLSFLGISFKVVGQAADQAVNLLGDQPTVVKTPLNNAAQPLIGHEESLVQGSYYANTFLVDSLFTGLRYYQEDAYDAKHNPIKKRKMILDVFDVRTSDLLRSVRIKRPTEMTGNRSMMDMTCGKAGTFVMFAEEASIVPEGEVAKIKVYGMDTTGTLTLGGITLFERKYRKSWSWTEDKYGFSPDGKHAYYATLTKIGRSTAVELQYLTLGDSLVHKVTFLMQEQVDQVGLCDIYILNGNPVITTRSTQDDYEDLKILKVVAGPILVQSRFDFGLPADAAIKDVRVFHPAGALDRLYAKIGYVIQNQAVLSVYDLGTCEGAKPRLVMRFEQDFDQQDVVDQWTLFKYRRNDVAKLQVQDYYEVGNKTFVLWGAAPNLFPSIERAEFQTVCMTSSVNGLGRLKYFHGLLHYCKTLPISPYGGRMSGFSIGYMGGAIGAAIVIPIMRNRESALQAENEEAPPLIKDGIYSAGSVFAADENGPYALAEQLYGASPNYMAGLKHESVLIKIKAASGFIIRMTGTGETTGYTAITAKGQDIKVVPNTSKRLPNGQRVIICQDEKTIRLVRF